MINHGILWVRFHSISYNMSTFTYNSTRLQPGFSWPASGGTLSGRGRWSIRHRTYGWRWWEEWSRRVWSSDSDGLGCGEDFGNFHGLWEWASRQDARMSDKWLKEKHFQPFALKQRTIFFTVSLTEPWAKVWNSDPSGSFDPGMSSGKSASWSGSSETRRTPGGHLVLGVGPTVSGGCASSTHGCRGALRGSPWCCYFKLHWANISGSQSLFKAILRSTVVFLALTCAPKASKA